MPLEIEVWRDGERRHDIVWDGVVLSCIYTAAYIEGDPKAEYRDGATYGALEGTGKFVDFSMAPIYYLDSKAPLVKRGRQVFKREHRFKILRDGTEEFVLASGDEVRAWRSSKR